MSTSVTRRVPWHSIVVLGLAAFAVVSAEFLPVGILPQIALDDGVPLGLASLVVLVPGLVAGLFAPLIVTAAGHLDRRTMIVALVAVLFVSNVGTWLVGGFGFLLLWRFLLGLALGGFWAVGPSLGARLAPSRPAVATSVVIAGISAGTVLGLPLGSLIESAIGWRSAFAVQAALAVIVLVLVLVLLPSGLVASAVSPRQLLDVVIARETRIVLVLTAVAVTAQLIGSTFVGALLDRDFAAWQVTLLLLMYGAVGLGANLGAPRLRVGMPRLFAVIAVTSAVVFAVLAIAMQTGWLVVVALVLWGAAWGMLPLVSQTWTMAAVPKSPEAGSTVLVVVLQLSIALGSALGGIAVSVGGLPIAYALGAVLFAVASVIAVAQLSRPGVISSPTASPASPATTTATTSNVD